MRRALLFILALTSSVQAADSPKLRYDGIGKIKFGMTLAEAEKVLKQEARIESDYVAGECNYIHFAGFEGVAFMIENHLIVRADANSDVKNELGITVGDQFRPIKIRFPDAKIQSNQYDDEGIDMWIVNPKGKGAFVLYESEGKILSIRAGIEPAVSYVEGCL